MGVLNDLLVVPESDLPKVAETLNPAAAFGGVDAKGLTTAKLYVLQMVLTGVSFEEAMEAFVEVVETSEGPWVTRIPAGLVRRLAAMSEERQEVVARRWAREADDLDWDESDFAAALDRLCELARKATKTGHVLVLWTSL